MAYVRSVHLCIYIYSLITESCAHLQNKAVVLVFVLLICLQRVCCSPSSQVSHLLQQNEVSKYISGYISGSCTEPLFFWPPSLCIVISFYNSLHLALLQLFFFPDLCSFNICFLAVASGGAMNAFHGATKTFDIYYNCSLKQLPSGIKQSTLLLFVIMTSNCFSLFFFQTPRGPLIILRLQ